jgi:hypothetical protein
MKRGSGTIIGLLATLALAGPASAAAEPGVIAAVWTVHGQSASGASSLNVLTLNDQRQIDNRISAYTASTGRLVLTAPEGLGDPDGSGASCKLDNAKPGESTAQEVSCDPGYIGAIVGDLNAGNDVFDAEPTLGVYVGAVIDGQRRSLSGGTGRDRLVGGAAQDLLDGGCGPDSIVGSGNEDFLIGGPGADNLSGGGGNDVLNGLAGPDRLNGGGGRDLCKGGTEIDSAKHCETARGIP